MRLDYTLLLKSESVIAFLENILSKKALLHFAQKHFTGLHSPPEVGECDRLFREHPEQKSSASLRSACDFFFFIATDSKLSSRQKRKSPGPSSTYQSFFAQSGCRDLNPGPLAPQTSTLTGLSYIPINNSFKRCKNKQLIR
jgi:hypothetical protein